MQWQFRFEPAVWLGVVRAALALGMAFGVHMTPEQMALSLALAEALLALVQRSVVTPNAKLS